jgi:hypothetical protein
MKKSRSIRFLHLFLLLPAGLALMLVSSPGYADLNLDFLVALTTGVSTESDSGQWGAGTHALLQTIDDVSNSNNNNNNDINNTNEKSVSENYSKNSAMVIRK